MRDKLRTPALAALSLLLAAPLLGCPAEPEDDPDHGVVWLQMLRGESESDSPYFGTVTVEITLLYLECLIDFYEMNPDYQQGGPEGALVFGTREDGGEGWLDRLCEQSNPNAADCTVQSFRQEFDTTRQLTVNYSVNGDIENREIPFGPLPIASLAACEAGSSPTVRVGSNGAVRGIDGEGNTIWNTESFNPPEAATGQGASIRIRAARN